MASKILSAVMSFVFPFYVFASPAATVLKPNFDEQASYVEQMQETIASFSQKNYVEKSFATLKETFTDKADRLYMQKIMGLDGKPAQLSVKAVHRTIEITATGLSKIVLSDFDPKTRSMKINGKIFKVTAGKSFEQINQDLAKLISVSTQTRVIDLLMSQAQAAIATAVGVVFVTGFVVLVFWKQLSMINAVTDKINTINKECENRDDQVPFENSQTKVLLKKIDALNTAIIPFPKIEAKTECSAWAGDLVSLLHKHLIAVTPEMASRWCFGLKMTAKCVDDYKAGIARKNQDESKVKRPAASQDGKN